MKRFCLIVVFFAIVVAWPQNTESSRGLIRHRRGLVELLLTVWCYRDRLDIDLDKLHGYGCYCGTGGSGAPTDPYDACCFRHDCCYDHARVNLKCFSMVKWMPYWYRCKRGRTVCTGKSVCSRMSCECDKQFAECLSHVKSNSSYYFYDKSRLCPGPMMDCPKMFPSAKEVFKKMYGPRGDLTE
ncbi:phospholipase A2, minor isoenzyme-like [Acipenser oxyrinchus oxyrinchus]|uniref:Phospholipase A2 n=1 Tax=Acipenser oxyrinchus oxyrinchus TaxID=40147 RepID=A0AAD8D3E6_ACIOX|nr:phospholipase A2, minor isoenzyme-like [Acipenser oxyrinchus oxyrinchus]